MSTLSMYEQVLGESYGQLPMAVQRFHRLAGRSVLHGWVEIEAPATALARLLAWCLGTPRQATRGPLRFEIEASPHAESWTRFFPAHTMRSEMRLVDRSIEEQLGWSRLRFALHASQERLTMRLTSLRFLGLPCPRWLMPSLLAEEAGNDELLQFRVSAALPLIGLVASYRGNLQLVSAQQEMP